MEQVVLVDPNSHRRLTCNEQVKSSANVKERKPSTSLNKSFPDIFANVSDDLFLFVEEVNSTSTLKENSEIVVEEVNSTSTSKENSEIESSASRVYSSIIGIIMVYVIFLETF
jgi:hypothetical protein